MFYSRDCNTHGRVRGKTRPGIDEEAVHSGTDPKRNANLLPSIAYPRNFRKVKASPPDLGHSWFLNMNI